MDLLEGVVGVDVALVPTEVLLSNVLDLEDGQGLVVDCRTDPTRFRDRFPVLGPPNLKPEI